MRSVEMATTSNSGMVKKSRKRRRRVKTARRRDASVLRSMSEATRVWR